jgi:hypothetical protein
MKPTEIRAAHVTLSRKQEMCVEYSGKKKQIVVEDPQTHCRLKLPNSIFVCVMCPLLFV